MTLEQSSADTLLDNGDNSKDSNNDEQVIKLDYTLQTPQERNELITKIIQQAPKERLTPHYLEILADYVIFAMDKQEKQQKEILTSNRLVTVNKRETSYEGLCGKLENGEDGIYNMLSDLGKTTILTPKDPITEQDIQNIPELQELRKAIQQVEKAYSKASGKQKFLLKKQIIEMRQDQYVIRNSFRAVGYGKTNSTAKTIATLNFIDDISFDDKHIPINNGLLSFFNPKHIEALLCNYSDLKEAAWGQYDHDLWYVMNDLDNLIDSTLKVEYPLYYDILIYKIDGKTNIEIQEILKDKHNMTHSIEYISALWRNKIPKLLAEEAQNQYLIWYYSNKEYGKWKKCSRCGQIKLAHNRFFSKNKSSKDGWYSLCKDCRNANSNKSKQRQAAKQLYLNSTQLK